MFTITSAPIDVAALRGALGDPGAGAVVIFEGRVRNRNEGRSVESLEYEAFAELAEMEGNRVLEEAQSRYDILGVHAVHRVGHLAIGDTAVWVGATAPHRDAAFKACQYVIDELKHRLPIWKKEHYTDGDAQWVNCRHCHTAAAKPAGRGNP